MGNFDSTLRVLKQISPLPVASYLALSFLVAFTLDSITALGNWSYVLTLIGFPQLIGTIDKFSEGELLKTLRSEWLELSTATHALIILDVVLMYNLVRVIKGSQLVSWLREVTGK